MKIISIANQKGGCGKTTTTINLAAALSQNGRRVLLLDLDPQAHATLGLNCESRDSIYNVISRLTPRKLKLDNIITSTETFDLVPANVLVGTLEQELADEIGRELKLTEVLATVRDRYDYILIDCPPSLGFLTINAIRASDEITVPVETSRFSIQGVDHLMDIVHLIRDRLNHPVICRILVTMFDSRLRHSFSMLSKIRERFPDAMLDTMIHTNVKLKESAVMGMTVLSYDKYCRGSKDYIALAKEIIALEKVETEETVAQPSIGERPAETASETDAAAAADNDQVFQGMSDKMQDLVREAAQDMVMTTFALKSPGAQSVYVTGSFNDWSLEERCRMQPEDGRWIVSIPLKPGHYKYQFIVDGNWREDPDNPQQERNSFGDINSLIEVADHA